MGQRSLPRGGIPAPSRQPGRHANRAGGTRQRRPGRPSADATARHNRSGIPAPRLQPSPARPVISGSAIRPNPRTKPARNHPGTLPGPASIAGPDISRQRTQPRLLNTSRQTRTRDKGHAFLPPRRPNSPAKCQKLRPNIRRSTDTDTVSPCRHPAPRIGRPRTPPKPASKAGPDTYDLRTQLLIQNTSRRARTRDKDHALLPPRRPSSPAKRPALQPKVRRRTGTEMS